MFKSILSPGIRQPRLQFQGKLLSANLLSSVLIKSYCRHEAPLDHFYPAIPSSIEGNLNRLSSCLANKFWT